MCVPESSVAGRRGQSDYEKRCLMNQKAERLQHTATTFFNEHCKPWSTLNSFNDACRSCQSGMWPQHTRHAVDCHSILLGFSRSRHPNRPARQSSEQKWCNVNTCGDIDGLIVDRAVNAHHSLRRHAGEASPCRTEPHAYHSMSPFVTFL